MGGRTGNADWEVGLGGRTGRRVGGGIGREDSEGVRGEEGLGRMIGRQD